MIATTIRLLLANLPLILFVLAFVIAFARRDPPHLAERLLAWLLLLSVGVEGAWAGFFHVAFPHVAAATNRKSKIENRKFHHSVLKASIGSTRAARRAGMMQAMAATTAKNTATPAKIAGSNGLIS